MAGVAVAILEEVAVVTLAAAVKLEGFTGGSGLWHMESTDRSRRGNAVIVRGIDVAIPWVLRVLRSI